MFELFSDVAARSLLHKMAEEALRELGLNFLEPELSSLESGHQIRMRLHCSRVEDMRTFATPTAASTWMSDIFKKIQTDLLDSPLLSRQLEQANAKIASLTVMLGRAQTEREELLEYKSYYAMAMKMRHGEQGW